MTLSRPSRSGGFCTPCSMQTAGLWEGSLVLGLGRVEPEGLDTLLGPAFRKGSRADRNVSKNPGAAYSDP